MACGRLCGRLIGDNATAARLESVNVETGENFVFLVSMLADSGGVCGDLRGQRDGRRNAADVSARLETLPRGPAESVGVC